MSKLPTVVILAGGENSRFFPLNTATHKGALQLCGKPLIVRTLENLQEAGYHHVVIIVSKKDYDGNGLSGFLSSFEHKLTIDFVLQPEAKGMGNALLCAAEKIEGHFAVTFPFLFDSATTIAGLIDQAGKGGAMTVGYTDKPWLYGIVTLAGKRIENIVEKPEPGTEPSNLYATGTYYLSHEFLAFLKETPQQEYSFEQALDKYFQVFEVHAMEQRDVLPSLKYPWQLFDFQSILFEKLPSYVSPYAHVAKTVEIDESMGNVYIENGARIGHASRIVGPCYIGKDVSIGDFSLVRSSSFEEGSSVGVHSDVARSIVMQHASMHNGFLGDSIVGPHVRIGAGFITSNKRIDRAPVVVSVKGNEIVTDRTALGTVIGQSAKLGIRVATMPGKFIGTDALVYPNTTVYAHVPHNGVLKIKEELTLTEREQKSI